MKRTVIIALLAVFVITSCKRRHAEIVDNPSVNNVDALGIDSINNSLAPEKDVKFAADSVKP
ncbi:MAG: hypothetical protein U0T73_10030 [Chitinophagales bacterium]